MNPRGGCRLRLYREAHVPDPHSGRHRAGEWKPGDYCGPLVVEDGIIIEVGERTRLEARGPFEAELGGTDRMILPGFVYGHYHTGV